MRVLLTGAFGNVGQSALAELLERGHRVRCFDLPTAANRKAARRWERRSPRVEVVWGDLRRAEDVAAAVRDQDVVIHLAFIIPKLSRTGIDSEERPDLAQAVNLGGTRNLLEALKAQPNPPCLIFSSSLHVYGRTEHLPPPRTADEACHPVEHYAQHKLACEQMIKASGLKWAILRFAAVLPLAIRLDPGMFDVPLDNRIEFVHTHDVGLALARAVESETIWGRTLLIGGGKSCQLYFGEMARRILEASGVGMLPKEAFSTTPFCTDWLDTTESEQLLHYQHRTFDDYLEDMKALLGPRRFAARLARPLVRWALLKQSPYYQVAREAARRASEVGRVALVSGASSGIGAATAKALAARGYRVALVARRKERLEHIAAQIRATGGEALSLPADLTLEAERVRVVEAVRQAYGPIDLLINSAGLGWYGFGSEMTWPMARQMLEVNVAAIVHLTLLVLPEMRQRNRGQIINVGSVAGSLPSQGIALYGATKSFLDAFTSALYRELRGTDVRVSVVRPGAVATEFFEVSAQASGQRTPMEGLAVPLSSVVRAILGLLERPNRVVYVPGVLRLVPWVELCCGWIIDRLGPLLLRRAATQPSSAR